MKICSVNGCQLKALNLEVAMCKFPPPEEPERRAKWVKFCNRDRKWEPYKFSSICSGHFLPEDFLGSSKQRILKVIAVPTQLTCKVSNSSNITESERVPPVHDNLGTSFKQIASRENLTKLLSNKIINQEEAQMICRVCLTASTPFISLFAKFEGQYVAYMLTFCTSLNIHREDEFPQFVCDSCFKKIKIAFDLKKTSMQSDIYLRTLKLPPPTETLNDKREISVPRSKNKPNNYQPATHTTNHFMIQDQVALQQSPKHFIIEESKVVSSLTNSTATDDSKYKIRSQPKSLIQRDRNSQSSTHFIIGESKVTSTLSTPKKYKIGPPKVQSPRHFIIDESRAKQKPARRIAMKNSIAPSSCNKLDPISFPTSSNRKRELSYEEYEKEMKKNKKSNKIQTKLNKTTDAKTVGSTESHKANKRSKPDDDFANALIPEIIYDPPEVNKDVPIKQEPHDKSNSNKVRKLEPNQQNNVVEKSAPKVKDEPESDDDTIEFRASDYDFLR